MDAVRSPLFPASALALSPAREDNPDEHVLIPNLPDTPQALLLSVQVFIVPAEKHLFLQGFKPAEYETRPPSLLRGCLVIRILKPVKIKLVTLQFKGIQRTEWPEGIPPKRQQYSEINDLVSHTWPFYHADTHSASHGADFVRPLPKNTRKSHDDISHLSLTDAAHSTTEFHPPRDTARGFAASLINRATSPRGVSPSPVPGITPVSSMADLTSVLSASSAADVNLSGDSKPGSFSPGDYVYNFEHPIPALSPETVDANFGRVTYHLEAHIIRMGAFKTNLTARLPISVVRIPSDNSVEENEPIFIDRDWEDQLRYEILVGTKAVILDTYVPISFKFIPLYGKVALHRIRVFITENCNYYCHNKTVHRAEPTRKFLLLEHKAKTNKSLLSGDDGPDIGDPDDEILPRELEFQMFVPSTINKKYHFAMHPDTSFENIQCDHWVKISLRISRTDPSNPEKRKHFEISIDSPIHICSPLAAHCNTLLPAYERPVTPETLPQYEAQSPPMSPEVTAVDHLQGLGHLLFSALSSYSIKNTPDSSPQRARAPSRSGTPVLFHHLSNSNEPLASDHRIHLEANLYSPTESNVLEALGLPQAQPTLRPQSPFPTPRPDALRRPTVNPPSFEMANASFDNTLPPAYEKEDPATSPLRTSTPTPVSSKKESLRRSTGARELGLHLESLRHIADTGVNSSGIKNRLNSQFDSLARSLAHTLSSKSSFSSHRKESTEAEARSDAPSVAPSETQSDAPSIQIEAKPEAQPQIQAEAPVVQEELDPKAQPETLSPTQSAPEIKLPSPKPISPVGLLRPKSPNIPESENDMDLAETYLGSPKSPAIGPLASRRSSLALAVDEDLPLEQTMPLLTLTGGYTEENISNLLLEDGRRPSAFWGTSMADLMDHLGAGIESRVFRNPRLQKHYQDEDIVATEPAKKDRQKSFGVIPTFDVATPDASASQDASDTPNATARTLTESSPNEWISEVTDSSGNKINEGFRFAGINEAKGLVQ